MVTRVSTFGLAQYLNSNNAKVQGKLAELTIQQSSGLKSPDFKGISKDSKQLTALDSDLSRLAAYSANSKIAENKFNIQVALLNTMLDRVESFKVDVTAALGGTSDIITDQAYVNAAQADLDDFIGTLNTKQGGQYLFSGTAWNVQPVDPTALPWANPIVPPSVADTSYYQGDNGNALIPIADGVTVDHALSGNDPAFELALRAMRLIVDNPGSNAARLEAFDLIDQATHELAALRSSVASQAGTVERQSTLNDLQGTFIAEAISGIRDVDIAAVAVASNQLTSQLEASYSVTARALRLSLLDFI